MHFLNIFRKDLAATRNRWHLLAFMYILYFAIALYSMQSLKTVLFGQENYFILVFVILFVSQAALIMAVMIFPQYVYSESMTSMHEIYFAYGYSVSDIVLSKSLILTLLSLTPAYVLAALFMPVMITDSWPLIVSLGAGVPGCVFAAVSFYVYFSWFSKIGRFSSVFLIVIIVLVFPRAKSFIQSISHLPMYLVPVFLIFFSLAAFGVLVVMCRKFNIEKAVLG